MAVFMASMTQSYKPVVQSEAFQTSNSNAIDLDF